MAYGSHRSDFVRKIKKKTKKLQGVQGLNLQCWLIEGGGAKYNMV
jgi:hypothetical protein